MANGKTTQMGDPPSLAMQFKKGTSQNLIRAYAQNTQIDTPHPFNR